MRLFNIRQSILKFFRLTYIKLFRINDTPQKIAQGLGIGVFTGIIPSIGPLTAIFLALLLKANRASALLGSLITNTWLSVATFLLSIKVSSVILGVSWQEIYRDWSLFLKDFHWLNLFKFSILKIILPVIIGYLVVGFCLGLVVYLVTLIILILRKQQHQA